MRNGIIFVFILGLLAGCSTYAKLPGRLGLPPGHGGVPPGHGGIPPGQAKKMGPPAVVVVGSVTHALVPGTNVKVILGVDADVFAVNGTYYYFHEGLWYRGSHYRGPWSKIDTRHLPRGLKGKSPKELKAKVKNKGGKGRGGKGR